VGRFQGAAIAKLLEDQPCHQEEDLMAEIPSIYVSKEHIPLNSSKYTKVKTTGFKIILAIQREIS